MSDSVRRVAIIAAIALAALAAGDAAPAHGASFTVNATHDSPDAAPGDGACADAGGACTLRAAVEETNAFPGADAVSVPAGVYVLTQTAGADGYVVGIGISDDLSLTGAGAANTAIDGGGNPTGILSIFKDLSTGVSADISDISIRNGYGGVGVSARSTLTLRRVAVIGNDGTEGAIRVNGTAHVFDSVIANNLVDPFGAGIFVRGTLTVTNSTISGNRARAGGGIFVDYGTASLTNVTVAGNTGVFGPGGISGSPSAMTLRNTIVANNSGGDCGGGTSLGHNLDSDGTCGLTGPGDRSGVDPQLTGLQNNGGPTLTHGLYPNSPAIDAGDNNGCPATDQRGVARPQGAACDIGAYEYVTPPTAPPAEPTTDTPPPPTDAATEPPTAGPTPKPKGSPSPSASPTPSLNLSSPAGRQRSQPTFAAVLVDVPRQVPAVEEDAGGSVSTMAVGLASVGAMGLAGSAASAGFFWHRRRRHRRRLGQ